MQLASKWGVWFFYQKKKKQHHSWKYSISTALKGILYLLLLATSILIKLSKIFYLLEQEIRDKITKGCCRRIQELFFMLVIFEQTLLGGFYYYYYYYYEFSGYNVNKVAMKKWPRAVVYLFIIGFQFMCLFGLCYVEMTSICRGSSKQLSSTIRNTS